MAANWPAIDSWAIPAKKRAGGGYAQWSAQATTKMPCGHEITERVRGKDKGPAISDAERQVRARARRHATAHGCYPR